MSGDESMLEDEFKLEGGSWGRTSFRPFDATSVAPVSVVIVMIECETAGRELEKRRAAKQGDSVL